MPGVASAIVNIPKKAFKPGIIAVNQLSVSCISKLARLYYQSFVSGASCLLGAFANERTKSKHQITQRLRAKIPYLQEIFDRQPLKTR
jgi:hypothetical protein